MKNIGWLATEYWISSFLSRVTKKRANKFRRPTFISMFGIIFLLFSFWSGWSGYIILYVHSKSHINDYFVNARQIKTNIHVFVFLGMVFYKSFFYLFGRRAVVALCWIWGLFFNWKKMCPFVRLDFFSITKFENYYNLEN
jgi:hypothetical protein